MAARFADTLQMAAAHGLGVQVTLFDWWDAYSEIAQSRTWLTSLLRPYAADPEIRLVELKNEVDPSDPAQMAWVRALLPTLRAALPGTPATVSVSGTQGPHGFSRLRSELGAVPLDVADIHFYGSEGAAYSWMLAAKRAAGSLPLFVGEIGSAALDGPEGGGLQAVELGQAHWFNVVFAAARAARVPTPAPWTLYNFDPGTIPARDVPAREYGFGLYTASGQPRPAASVVQNAFRGHPSDTSNLGFSLAGQDGMPAVWSPYLADQGALAYDPKVGHLRAGSVRLSSTRSTSLGAPSFYLIPVDPPLPGQLWTITAWARGTGVNGTAEIALAWFSSAGSFLGNSVSGPLRPGNPGWTQLLVRSPVPAGATSVQIHLKSVNVSGTVWFDDVGIKVIS